MVPPRQFQIERLKSQIFDLLVIGGGITGVGIALDAASRGLSVALVEKGDFASGTSSKSTKLIHGGLRYLKQLELKVVQEVGRERAIVHQLAPHLVQPEKMLLPIYRGGSFGKTSTAVGLWLYDFLAGVKKADQRRMLSRPQSLAEEPLLRQQGLLGGGLYAEYRTDDARLTIEVAKTAVRHGAICLNYVEATGFLDENGQLVGATCQDHFSDTSFNVKASAIVNAAGPWVDQLRQAANARNNKRIFLSKGIHIVVPRARLPLRHSVYFDVKDGRMVFAVPRQRATYIGTTDTAFNGSPDDVFAAKPEIEYLLDAANGMFPSVQLSSSDVESTWAGLRPLIFEEGKSAGAMSRRDEIFVAGNGLISVAGGKLTGYRKMAEKLVDLVLKKLGKPAVTSATKSIPLTPLPFGDVLEVADFQAALIKQTLGLDGAGDLAVYLTENYGHAAAGILEAAFAEGKKNDEAVLLAELSYCLLHEMTLTPIDFLERRTGLLLFNIQRAKQHQQKLLAAFQVHFNWSEEKLAQETMALDSLMRKLNPVCG